MIQLAALSVRTVENPEGDIEKVSTGKRPGKKMYGELFYDETNASNTRRPKRLRAANYTFPGLDEKFAQLGSSLDREDEAPTRKILFD